MTPASAIVTVGQVQAYMNDTSTDANWLAFLLQLVNYASEQIATFIGFDWTHSNTVAVQWMQQTNAPTIRTPNYSVGSFATLFSYDSTNAQTDMGVSNLWQYSEAMTDANNPSCANRTVAFKDGSWWQQGLYYKLTYQTPTTWVWPNGLQELCIEICATYVRESGYGPATLGMRSHSEKTAFGQDQFVDQWKEWRNRMRPYRNTF